MAECKSNGNFKRALPKVNERESTVLYVGKTDSNFGNRLNQHLGFGPEKTYALQLVHWAKDLQLRLHYAYVDAEGDLLEHQETVLHKGLQPVLGRSGS